MNKNLLIDCGYRCKKCGNEWYHWQKPKAFHSMRMAGSYAEKCRKCGALVTPLRCEVMETAI